MTKPLHIGSGPEPSEGPGPASTSAATGGTAAGTGPSEGAGAGSAGGERYGRTADGKHAIFHVPLGYHESFPPELRPKLALFKDVWFGIFLVFCVLATCGTAFTQLSALVYGADAWAALVVGWVVALVYILVFMFGARFLLIAKNTPKRLYILSLWWGASTAVMLSLLTSEDAATRVAYKLGVPALEMSFAGGWVEETTKALGVWFCLWMGRAWWNRPWHGLVAGFFVGLGFEISENVLYASAQGLLDAQSDFYGALSTALQRTVLGFGLHPMLTSIAGFGIGLALYAAQRTWAWRLANILGFGFIAFVFHGLWNVEWPTSFGVIVNIAVWVVLFIVWLTLVAKTTKQAREQRSKGLYPAVTTYLRISQPVPGPAWPVGAPGVSGGGSGWPVGGPDGPFNAGHPAGFDARPGVVPNFQTNAPQPRPDWPTSPGDARSQNWPQGDGQNRAWPQGDGRAEGWPQGGTGQKGEWPPRA
ncbi:PrsW family intramembrane metalloprotease [Corynebacterium heidelbergense]|uniref:PrsW family intramembrane metalloprotease n=1 Tax=Corynebacterium heidelbergense TaxID=2055947 RepID=A0A364V853_9CORY|nr:PrsW family intramembrane metalloprotease [Corynebacterium heidelbergense]RAV32843.1 hypothetical protein CWC39_10160 [Corynebacterium heidelbergense]WCZ35674.1 hypothetical protein CHEID_00460 [Corynebacterium heidelbergense]